MKKSLRICDNIRRSGSNAIEAPSNVFLLRNIANSLSGSDGAKSDIYLKKPTVIMLLILVNRMVSLTNITPHSTLGGKV
jgi:hypothetical protein